MAESIHPVSNTPSEKTGENSRTEGHLTSTSESSLQDSTSSDDTRTKLLDRVAKSDGFFRSQQRGEPDLTYSEKLNIATDMLINKPSTFLNRFGKYFVEDDLQYFQNLRTDYTIDFHVKEIKKRFDDRKSQTKIRNRRFEAMKELVDRGEYFSDREMKSRDPRMYELMVGKYLTDEEIQQQAGETDGSISSVLFHHIEALHNNELYATQIETEMSQMEEVDSDEEQDTESEEEEELEDEDDENEPRRRKPSISDEERHMLRHEFLATMQQRFLHGQDQEFDYRKVDDNVEYDPLSIRAQDEEEKYFDDEDTASAGSRDSSTAGSMNTAPCSGSNTPRSVETGPSANLMDITPTITMTHSALCPESMDTNNGSGLTDACSGMKDTKSGSMNTDTQSGCDSGVTSGMSSDNVAVLVLSAASERQQSGPESTSLLSKLDRDGERLDSNISCMDTTDSEGRCESREDTLDSDCGR